MRRLGTAITLGLLLAGTAAYAQTPTPGVSGLTYFAKTTSTLGIFESFQALGGPGFPIDVSGSRSLPGSGQTVFSAYVQENPGGTITFENSTIAGGSAAGTTATSTIGFNFYDAEDVPFESLITPAGIGFYLANLQGCSLSLCPKIGDGPGFPTLADVQGFGAVGFDFSIMDGTEVLFKVSGSSLLAGGQIFQNFTGTGQLNGFGPAYNSQPQAYGVHWQETLVPRTLAGGVLHNLTYTTTVSSLVATAPTSPCGLVGYAGFGDPIGRGGGALFSALFFQAGGAVAAAVAPCGADNDGGRPGIGFTPITLPKPVFENGVLRFGPTAVPEPATWAMMILGFGGIGAVVRRRRTLGAHA